MENFMRNIRIVYHVCGLEYQDTFYGADVYKGQERIMDLLNQEIKFSVDYF